MELNSAWSWAKANWDKLLVIIVVIILLSVLFRGCDTTPPVESLPTPTANQVTIDSASYWKQETAKARATIDSLMVEKVESDLVLRKADKELSALVVKYNTLRKAPGPCDTILPVCDDLAAANVELRGLVTEYQSNMDELLMSYDRALAASDSAAIKQTQLAEQWRSTATASVVQYNDLAKQFNRQTKKNKRERTLSRVLAGVVLVLGGVIALK